MTVTVPDSAQEFGDTRLIPSYTFEEFVIGPHNRFPHAASLAVSENLGKAYNPLFIYGPVGIGKTHLMQAVGHRVSQRDPKSRVLYVTAQQFMSDVIELLQQNRLSTLRERYRALDLLLVDDIQFLATSEATQDEFFHMFNDLHSAGKQIIMTSDRPPKMLTTLEDRLRSRFEWGLIADIKFTNLETRVAILRKKEVYLKGIQLADDIRIYIASRLKSNIRELEGFLRRVQAYSQLNNQPINLELVQEIMKELLPPEEWVDDAVAVEGPAPAGAGEAPPPVEAPAAEEPAAPPPAPDALSLADGVSGVEPGPPPLPAPEAPLDLGFSPAPSPAGPAPLPSGLPGVPPPEAPPVVMPPVFPPAGSVDLVNQPNFIKSPGPAGGAGMVALPSNPGDIPVVFFFPMGRQGELEKMKKKFSDIIHKHKLKINLQPFQEVAYEATPAVNYDMFVDCCHKARVGVAVLLGPPPDGNLGETLFIHRLQEIFEPTTLSLQFVPWDDLSKDYRFLNLALDITLIRIKNTGR